MGDVARDLFAVRVHDVGELDRGILVDELLHDRLLHLRTHRLHDGVVDHLLNHRDGGLGGAVLDLFEI